MLLTNVGIGDSQGITTKAGEGESNMKVIILEPPEEQIRCPSYTNCNAIKNCIAYYAGALLDPDVREVLSYYVQFTKSHPSFHARCSWVDEFEFMFDVNCDLSFLQQIQALAHEMVHVKQYVSGELEMNDDGFMVWNADGSIWEPTTIQRMEENGTYNIDTPWEKEAFKREAILTMGYLQQVINEPDPMDI